MVDVSFYMLVEEEGSFSLALYDSEKNVLSNYSNLRQNVVNEYIENLENDNVREELVFVMNRLARRKN